MALIIEDGSIVANANSYVTAQEIKDYADSRGLTFVDPAAQLIQAEQFALLAMDLIEIKCFKGEQSDPILQELEWPRQNVIVDDVNLAADKIPSKLKQAQYEAAIAAQTQALLVNESTQNVASEKLDVMSKSYFKGGKKTKVILSRVNAKLKKLLKSETLKVTRA